MTNTQPLIDWLKDQHQQIKEIEKTALAMLDAGDDAGYRAKMRQKAEFLIKMEAEAKPLLAELPPAIRAVAEDTLHGFANGGKAAIHLNSVFYMSALLYPDDHKPGEPDNMEKFIEDLQNI